jgi:Sulfotransferase domain
VIVWVASFPRSGNTFLRIILNRVYGLQISVIYDVDGVAERLGADLVGSTGRPAGAIAVLRRSAEVHFIKTHRQRDDDVDERDRAICLVRDGRDALVSWARLVSETDRSPFEDSLRAMMNRRDKVGTGSWGSNVLSWLRPTAPHRVVLSYEELIREPRAVAGRVMAAIAPDLRPLAGSRIPSFAELHRIDNGFFRRGRTSSHRDEMPAELHELFWSKPDNVAAMRLLGYERSSRLISG